MGVAVSPRLREAVLRFDPSTAGESLGMRGRRGPAGVAPALVTAARVPTWASVLTGGGVELLRAAWE